MEYEPDANMLFNYLMVSALANVTERVEREGGRKTTGGMDTCSIQSGISTGDVLTRMVLF